MQKLGSDCVCCLGVSNQSGSCSAVVYISGFGQRQQICWFQHLKPHCKTHTAGSGSCGSSISSIAVMLAGCSRAAGHLPAGPCQCGAELGWRLCRHCCCGRLLPGSPPSRLGAAALGRAITLQTDRCFLTTMKITVADSPIFPLLGGAAGSAVVLSPWHNMPVAVHFAFL